MLNILIKRLGRSENYILKYDGIQPELNDKIKELPYEQRKWENEFKLWVIDAKGLSGLISKYRGRKDIFFKFEDDKQKEQYIKILAKHKRRIEKNQIAFENLQEENKRILAIKANLPELAKSIDYKNFLKDSCIPMEHQLKGAYFFNVIPSGIIAFEQGLGKTVLALLSALMDESIKQVLIISPANLKINWLKEIELFTKSNGYIIDLKKGKLSNYKRNGGRDIKDCKFIITNYEYFAGQNFDVDIKINNIGINPDLLILDESHRLTNKKAQSTGKIYELFEDTRRKFMLTGTPIRNRLSQLFIALKFIKPEEFSNESKYLKEYCGLKYEKGIGWIRDEKREPKYKELNEKLQTCMYRLKKDVLKDLPELYINKIYLEMSPAEAKEYKDIEEGFKKVDWNNVKIINTNDDDNTSPIVILSRLRQFTSKIKINYVKQLIEELNDLGEKVIVFDVFKKPLHTLKKELGDNTEVYDGDINAEKKQNLVDLFQDRNSILKNILISINAGSTGITLTEANRLFLISQDYLDSTNMQALSRAHRNGQLRDVFANILILVDTIDEIIDAELLEKKKMVNAVIDGEDYVEMAEISVFNDVLNKLRNMYQK